MQATPKAPRPAARRRVLLTGASGYVGGGLRRALEGQGVDLVCLARRPEFLRSRVGPGTRVVQGDVLDAGSLGGAMEGVQVAYYLVHSMGSSGDFELQDREGASNFAAAARAAGVERIVYLGGLGGEEQLSPHLRSRQEVGRILRESGVQTIELRASIVIGPGSLSFELVRALVERLPVMLVPRWTKVQAQPIAVGDLTRYLLGALDLELEDGGSRVYEIGGADRVSYEDLMREYARQRGLRRAMLRVPVISPRLSSLWLGLVTPVYARIGRKLIESIRHPTVVRDDAALRAFDVRPMNMAQAIRLALASEEAELDESRWFDALSSRGKLEAGGEKRFGNRLADSRSIHVDVPPEAAFGPIRRIGGRTGWYAFDWLWSARGWLDLLVGGVGTRRGRTHPERLRVGDALDFWRVEAFEEHRLLRLHAEMKVPGRAWLELEVRPDGRGGSTIHQTALFDPVGLAGIAYWKLVYPLHALVFRGLLRGIAREARRGVAR
jgi:uncharacterized protein YbjT (DUF2867 family)